MRTGADSGARLGWSIVTAALAVAVFMEAVFAGAMLSGAGWARIAHALNAALLVVSTATAALVCLFALRRLARGPRLGWTLLALALASALQAGLGAMSAKGANVAWLHVPLGAALVGLAALAVGFARTLDRT